MGVLFALQGMMLVYLFFGALTSEEATSVEYVASSGMTIPSYSWMKWKLESACSTVIRDWNPLSGTGGWLSRPAQRRVT